MNVKKEFLKGSLCREVILQRKNEYILGNGAIRLIEILFASELSHAKILTLNGV